MSPEDASTNSNTTRDGTLRALPDKFSRQGLVDQRAGFSEAEERDEGAEARPSLLAEKGCVEHIEEVV